MKNIRYVEGVGLLLLVLRWIEVGNSGVFRPEMLLPMGFPQDVTVIAWGLSLERYERSYADIEEKGFQVVYLEVSFALSLIPACLSACVSPDVFLPLCLSVSVSLEQQVVFSHLECLFLSLFLSPLFIPGLP